MAATGNYITINSKESIYNYCLYWTGIDPRVAVVFHMIYLSNLFGEILILFMTQLHAVDSLMSVMRYLQFHIIRVKILSTQLNN